MLITPVMSQEEGEGLRAGKELSTEAAPSMRSAEGTAVARGTRTGGAQLLPPGQGDSGHPCRPLTSLSWSDSQAGAPEGALFASNASSVPISMPPASCAPWGHCLTSLSLFPHLSNESK